MNMMNFYDEIRNRYGNVKRARGFYLYTEKNIRLLDMYLDGGMSILGRRENQAPLVFKQSIDKGLNAFLPSSGDYRLKKALNSLFSEHPHFYLLSEWSKAFSFLEIENNKTALDSCIMENTWKPFLPSSENLKKKKVFFVNPPFCTSIKIAVSKDDLPILSCAVSARSTKHAISGAIMGVILLTVITLMLLTVLLINPGFSSKLSLPMVGWSEAINTKFGLLYAFVLMGAIYQTATSTYYGFSITINNTPMKKTILSIGAIVAFIAGLTDFKKIVAILYPTQGYIGCIILILVAVNFIKIININLKNFNCG